ncbi:BREX-2 system adenine-specific DNA-methyltransferase PglX [Paractinoplanes rhizophilus]|uniref:site-specific DNA-methyltransferase (adenine-specific) n=1 Tax=Paractinoplanes rhizophilus TaxID=1416877 RepID=A0ABW2HUB4_9ACTN
MIELKALQGQVKLLVDDLRDVVADNDELRSSLKAEWKAAFDAQRTAATFESWLEDPLDQAAVAWVLGCVFVRFCEDNALIKRVWIGGPTAAAPVERAVRERQGYLIANPTHNDRHWLREAFKYLAELRPTGKIFDEHNPVWRFGISGRAAEALSDFFRRGDGYASLESPGLNTRFLGDLYQNLSAHARETYALLQTPEFVEEFILDRTFEPAYREFGLADTKVIDPTCGSGHFLLGAFDRLITRWKDREPAEDVRELVQRALNQVTGVDINPFAVAIARFRLMIAALNACGLNDLETAPAFNLRLATGDSLLGWGRSSTHQGQFTYGTEDDGKIFAFVTEDYDELTEYLRSNQYTVVVGNPPYITVKDKALNELYRKRYSACSGKYALTVPFAQLFFKLAKRGDSNGDSAGYVGQIAANSFMKREFGKKLINNFFAGDVELVEVIDASGAYIPGHGTPTVILLGRNRLVSSRYSLPVRAVLGIRGEPSQPNDPARGLVWRSIVDQIDSPNSESEWVSCADIERRALAQHPWSLSGGGAGPLMEKLQRGVTAVLSAVTHDIGIVAVTLEDDAYLVPERVANRCGVENRHMVIGDQMRDYSLQLGDVAAWPYAEALVPVDLSDTPRLHRFLWPNRQNLRRRVWFRRPIEEIPTMKWHEYGFLAREKMNTSMSIAFAFVATHNHFVLDRGGKVFKQSAPVIKLPEGATEDDHLRLLGVLNSSTACFWLKQVSHNKGRPGAEQAGADEPWEHRFEFTGTKLQEFPLPVSSPVQLAQRIDALAQEMAGLTPLAVSAAGIPTRKRLQAARAQYESVRGTMVAVQEELDWAIYKAYGLIDESLAVSEYPELQPAERAFAIVLARQQAAGETTTTWFRHHNHKFAPVTELPKQWSPDYRAVVERRIALIESDRNIGLIERPEFKRRWATKGWDVMQREALRDWLLDRLESAELWAGAPTPLSVAQLADRVRHDDDFRSVLELWVGSDQYDLVKTLGKLVADEHVPFLPALRYKAAGLRKRKQWEETWEQQRREDAGEKLDIPVPPKYTSGDFLKASYWRNRGKLDVPKERFVSYPNAGRDGDPTLLLGWAGWDHLAQAQAIATVYLDRKTQAGWKQEALLPLLAGLAELEPWLKQWHAEPQPGFPGSPAQFFTGFIDTELATLGADRAELTRIRGLS